MACGVDGQVRVKAIQVQCARGFYSCSQITVEPRGSCRSALVHDRAAATRAVYQDDRLWRLAAGVLTEQAYVHSLIFQTLPDGVAELIRAGGADELGVAAQAAVGHCRGSCWTSALNVEPVEFEYFVGGRQVPDRADEVDGGHAQEYCLSAHG